MHRDRCVMNPLCPAIVGSLLLALITACTTVPYDEIGAAGPDTTSTYPHLNGATWNDPTIPDPEAANTVLLAGTAYDDAAFEDEAYDATPTERYLVTYEVRGDDIVNPASEKRLPSHLIAMQENTEAHHRTWEYFLSLIPAEHRHAVSHFAVMTDGAQNTLAAVSQTEQDPEHWMVEVDLEDTDDVPCLTYTLIHEFGHLLTLGPDQVKPNRAIFENPDDWELYADAEDSCTGYFTGEGCAERGTYMEAFYTRFWPELFPEWEQINEIRSQGRRDNALLDFHNDHPGEFVTEYAATDPQEDIAESFAFFVLAPYPTGKTTAEQKVAFFYDYPELMALRASILAAIADAI